MNLNIREMLPKERDYAYTQSYQLMSQSGCIALMRGDFGNGGRTFYPDYEDQIKQYRTDEFAAEFDSVIKEFYKVGILADRDSMLEYCCARPIQVQCFWPCLWILQRSSALWNGFERWRQWNCSSS